jgi:flagellar biogenesis protein FliO
VRRHIQELEQAEKNAENKTPFADLLKESLDEQDPPRTS